MLRLGSGGKTGRADSNAELTSRRTGLMLKMILSSRRLHSRRGARPIPSELMRPAHEYSLLIRIAGKITLIGSG
jgi:hypothetical protein